ncbi:hypothetical protein QAD02_001796 [Eretmocerus hayati]|uniref:Uncharacterized protein n=1 Tax=Eretmocerus hayati TaxID=131215 RepID=A0ACC2NHG8_9HYME|nr:hypothetical protein QAD02_001796 [Eretmocerus hayati]
MVESLCKDQLAGARLQFDNYTYVKAALELEKEKLSRDNEELSNKLSMMTNKFTRSQTDYKNLAELKRKLEKEVERLSTLLDKTKKSSDPKIGRDNDIKQKKVLRIGEL